MMVAATWIAVEILAAGLWLLDPETTEAKASVTSQSTKIVEVW